VAPYILIVSGHAEGSEDLVLRDSSVRLRLPQNDKRNDPVCLSVNSIGLGGFELFHGKICGCPTDVGEHGSPSPAGDHNFAD